MASPSGSKRAKIDVRSVRTKLRLVHFFVRHGDRTPITALKDADFWTAQLPEPDAHPVQFKVVADDADVGFLHCMAGAAPFGQLTRRGIEQLRSRGEGLRKIVENIENVTCRSTYFTRTMQSAQHLLQGLGASEEKVVVDTRNWRSMIPDGDAEAFRELIKDFKPPLSEQDVEWRIELTKKLFGLGIYAFDHGPDPDEVHGIGLDRLTETLICLHTYNRLPPSITPSDVSRAKSQMATVDFALLSKPDLLSATMGPFVEQLLLSPIRKLIVEQTPSENIPPQVNIFSGHDTTLFGLIQAFNLRPLEGESKNWQETLCPNYADSLRLDLLEVRDEEANSENLGEEVLISSEYLDRGEKFFVRFVYDGHGLVSVKGHPLIFPAKHLKGIWESTFDKS